MTATDLHANDDQFGDNAELSRERGVNVGVAEG